MKPDPDNQLRKRIADALLAGDPCGHSDREIDRALDAVRDSGEASELTDIEIGRILLKMRRELPIGERVADAESPAPFPFDRAPNVEQKLDSEFGKTDREISTADENTVVRRPSAWWKTPSARAAMAAIWVFGLGFVLFQNLNQPADLETISSNDHSETVDSPGAPGSVPAASPTTTNKPEESPSPGHGSVAKLPKNAVAKVSQEDESAFVAISFHTDEVEKKRMPLSDGSVLFVNVNSKGTVDDLRRIRLERGEIFLEVAPRSEEDDALVPGGATFTVDTPEGEVAALGTKFGVSVSPSGTGVLVTQGTVRGEGLAKPLKAGQELLPGPKHPVSPSPRAAEALHWLRDLDAEAHPPAAPPNAFLGGVLIAYDENGREKRIELKSSQTNVTVEDGFAVTTIDQSYASNLLTPVEAVFYFPVPPDAAVTRFASGNRQEMTEADIVPREPARVAYKKAAAAGGRPGLMEWQDASTFSMRITPVEPGEEKRVRLSFTRRLNRDYGRTQYRLAGVGDAQFVKRWKADFRIRGGARNLWDSSSHAFEADTQGPDLILSSEDRAGVAHRDLVLNLYDRGRQSPVANATGKPRFSTFDGPGGRYLMVRHSPELGDGKVAKRRDWIFLYETSADRNVLEAKTANGIIRGILDHVGSEDTFAIVAVSTRPKVYRGGFQSVSAGNRAGISSFLNGLPKLGALNVEQAFAEASRLAGTVKDPVIVHLGSGIPVLGERNSVALLNLLPDAPYVGVGVGPRWNRPLMKYAAAKTGGFFTEVNPDEPARWRAFDLVSTLNAPRLIGVEVTAPNTGFKFHTFEDTLAQGEELCAIAKLPAHAPAPTQIAIHGFVDGDEWHQVVDVTAPKSAARYLADLWARLEIDSLLANGGGRDQVTAVSLTHHVLSPFTSFLTTPDADRLLVERKKQRTAELEELEKAPEVVAAREEKSDHRPLSDSVPEEAAEAANATSPPDAPLSPATAGPEDSTIAEFPGREDPSSSPTKPSHAEPQPPTVSAGLAPPRAPAPTDPSVESEAASAGTSPDALNDGIQVAGHPDSGEKHPDNERARKDRKPAESQIPSDPGTARSAVASAPVPKGNQNSDSPLPELAPMAVETEINDDKSEKESEASTASNPQPGELAEPVAKTHLEEGKGLDGHEDPFGAIAGGGSAGRPGGFDETDFANGKKRAGLGGLFGRVSKKLQDRPVELRQLQLVRETDATSLRFDHLKLAGERDSDGLVENASALEELRNEGGARSSGHANAEIRREQIDQFSANELIYRQPQSELLMRWEGNEAHTLSSLGDTEIRGTHRRSVDTPSGVTGDARGSSHRDDRPPLSQPPSASKPGSGGSASSLPQESTTEPLGDRSPLDRGTEGGEGGADVDLLNPGLSKSASGERTTKPRKGDKTDLGAAPPRSRIPAQALDEQKGRDPLVSKLRDHFAFWKRQAENAESKDAARGSDAGSTSTHYGTMNFNDPVDWTLRSTRDQVESEDVLAILLLMASARTDDPISQRKLSRAFEELSLDAPELDYASRYESARALLNSGDSGGALDAFTELYRSEIEGGTIPAIDGDLPRAFAQSGNIIAFYQLIRDAVEKMLADKRFEAAVAIAWQCQATGHQDLADELLERIEVETPPDRLGAVASAALKIFGAESEGGRVTEVLGLLIGDGADIEDSSLLRYAAKIAHRAGKRSHALEWLEGALSLDYGRRQPSGEFARVSGADAKNGFSDKSDARPLPTLDEVRKDFTQLFNLYHEQAAAMKTLDMSSSRLFSQQVIDSAENWRRLDPDPAAACRPAAEVFTLLGKNDLAWEFATTPLALSPNDASAWQSLAEKTGRTGLDEQATEAQRAAEAAAEASQ